MNDRRFCSALISLAAWSARGTERARLDLVLDSSPADIDRDTERDAAVEVDVGPMQRKQLSEPEGGEAGEQEEGRVLFVDSRAHSRSVAAENFECV